jgi:hypothetical protein
MPFEEFKAPWRLAFGDRAKAALKPVTTGCQDQVGELDAIMTKSLPTSDDSVFQKGMKAISSVGKDGKVDCISKALYSYMTALTLYCYAVSSMLQPSKDSQTLKYICS